MLTQHPPQSSLSSSSIFLTLTAMAAEDKRSNDSNNSKLTTQNLALAISAAAALFYTISSLDVDTSASALPAAAQISNQWVHIGILLFAMLTLSMLAADSPKQAEQDNSSSSSASSSPSLTPLAKRHGEKILPSGEVADRHRRRGSSITWADD